MVIAESWIDYGWILLTFFCLLTGAYFDLKTRVIPDKIWLIQLIGSIILLVFWFLESPRTTEIILVVTNIIFGFILFFILLLTGAMAGGDIKAFFVLSFSYPIATTLLTPIFELPLIFPGLFSILLNFLLMYILLALSFFIYNFVQLVMNPSTLNSTNGTMIQQIRLLFDSYRVHTENIGDRDFYNPAEFYIDNSWQLKSQEMNLLMEDDEWEEYEKEERAEMLENIKKTNKEYIWIRPQIPGIPILYLSFVISITIGTILAPIFTILTS